MSGNICRCCEFCFPNAEAGFICADKFYGESVSDTLDVEKDCFSEGIEMFIESMKDDSVEYNNEPIKNIKIDGRKSIILQDLDGKSIQMKAKIAKTTLSEIPVIRLVMDDIYEVNAIFDKDLFPNGDFIRLK